MTVKPVKGVMHDEVDDGDVVDAGEFDVFDVHAEVSSGCVEGTRAGDRDEGVGVALADEERHAGGLLELRGISETDMVILADFYSDIGAKYPEKKTEPRLG